jgi:hypothetical protein
MDPADSERCDVALETVLYRGLHGQVVKAVEVSGDDALGYSVALAYQDVRLVKPEKISATPVPPIQA